MPNPPRANGYRRQEVDGLEVFVHPVLVQVAGQVTVELVGFWKIRWLKVSGAAPLAACSF